MAGLAKRVLLWFFSVLFLILAILFLFALIGLAIAGFVAAQISDQRYVEALESSSDDFEMIWYYFMLASSVTALPYSILGTIAIVLLVEAIRSNPSHDKRKVDRNKAMEETDSGTGIHADIHEGNVEGKIDVTKGVPVIHFKGATLAPASFGSVIAVFLSMIFSVIAMLCVFWGIAIAYDNARRVNKVVWPYIVVEFIVGLVMPLAVVFAAIVFSIYLEYATNGSVDPRVLVTRLLPVVKLVEGKEYTYWSILDRFYFQLSPNDNFRDETEKAENSDETEKAENSCSQKISRSPSTWIITAIVSLAFLLAVSYFMNANITSQTTLRSCPHTSVEIDCFNTSSLVYVDCNDPDIEQLNFTSLHCFRFLQFGRDSDVIGGLSRAFAFYLATLAFFGTAFHAAKILIDFQPSRLWGSVFIVGGILLFVGGILIVSTDEAVLLRIDIIKIFQFFMVALFVFLIGLLLVTGKWWERVPGTKNGLVSPGNIPEKRTFKDVENEVRDTPV
ncbi:PREDICTED: uncharacterized protein LOC100632627 [Amphimedon queenslandica]|uniref:Uncharacterized protein n=1 Tax=Amphimedon queenslandica TaxID=400682 RepID=A0A1X7UK73_AMPQE|nr:PREDICTED: uncharacterized protein LOC100632627 [Amphimedon queenslandica]|eukprot:XP_019853839.1 PREDICTED: uncharacterized protein LOC100632627 [Amphimedon queenslandica]